MEIHLPPFTTWYDNGGNEHYLGRLERLQFEIPLWQMTGCLNPESVIKNTLLESVLHRNRILNCMLH